AAAGAFWSGDVWVLGKGVSRADRRVYEAAFREGVPEEEGRFLRVARWRSRGAWVGPTVERSRQRKGARGEAPVVAFCSFKGGVGRTTALAAHAIRCARSGLRVVVLDLDLDAPGAGRLLAADAEGTVAAWGVVDYLLEAPFGAGPLDDYRHLCVRPAVTGDGQAIAVFPAGRVDGRYLRKLARVDLEVHAGDGPHPLFGLLDRIRKEVRPDRILVDTRAGLSPAAGLLLDGGADLYVLFATASTQSDPGIRRIVHRFGQERIEAGLPQTDCIVVQAMVPDGPEVGKVVKRGFAERMRGLFTEHYLVRDADDPEDWHWSIGDLDSSEAPHVPVPIRYREAFATFGAIDEVADELAVAADFEALSERIESRLAPRAGAER
ncbi:MAG: hypothetical protein QME96_16245, partial [Myxococcota bacterium]|nr:hypothetical protein [Myxococcota bacterium]